MDKISEARRSKTPARNQRCRKWWRSCWALCTLQEGKATASQQLPSLQSLSHTGFSSDSQISPVAIRPILQTNYELGVIHNSAAVLMRSGERRELPRIYIQSSLGVPRALVPGPPRIPKSADAQVPYIKWCSVCI